MLLRDKLAILHLGFLVLAVSPPASADRPEHLAGLDDHVVEVMRTMELPGLSLTLVDDTGTVIARGYGVRELGSAARVDQDTLFEIGSITKPFTATAIGILVERGEVSWNARIKEYVPYFELGDADVSDAFTVADALSHRGGYLDSYYYDVDDIVDREEMIRRLRFEKSVRPFRSGFEYHNAIFATAAEVIPALTGETWASFVEEHIFSPLGMNSSLVTLDGIERQTNIAAPHILTVNGMQSFSRAIDEPDPLPEAGAILSNASDMARWCRFQISGDSLGSSVPINGETLAEMRTLHTSGTLPWFGKWGYGNVRAGYGLGWKLFDYRGNADQLVAHGGAMDGIQAWMVFSPKNKYCIAMMSNGDWSGDPAHFAIANWIHDRYLGLEKKDWIAEVLEAEREAMVRQVQQETSEEVD